jgi:hypothetical protein
MIYTCVLNKGRGVHSPLDLPGWREDKRPSAYTTPAVSP